MLECDQRRTVARPERSGPPGTSSSTESPCSSRTRPTRPSRPRRRAACGTRARCSAESRAPPSAPTTTTPACTSPPSRSTATRPASRSSTTTRAAAASPSPSSCRARRPRRARSRSTPRRSPDGPHMVRLLVSDATETNQIAFGPVQITTRNLVRGALNGANASDRAKLTAHFAGRHGRSLTGRLGRRVRIVGRLTDENGRGIGGDAADPRSRPAPRGARGRPRRRHDPQQRLVGLHARTLTLALAADRLPLARLRRRLRRHRAALPARARRRQPAREPARRAPGRARELQRPAVRTADPARRQARRPAGPRGGALARTPQTGPGPPSATATASCARPRRSRSACASGATRATPTRSATRRARRVRVPAKRLGGRGRRST